MVCEIPEQLFQIGDEVETTEKYKQEIEEYNRILDLDAAPYKRGKITHIQTVTDFKRDNYTMDGMIWHGPAREIDNIWICVTLDNNLDKQVNQIYLRKLGDH